MQFDELPTPCLLLDQGRLEANVARMSRQIEALGVHLRPHLKTAKSVAVAEVATESRKWGITVSTLKEAAYFAGEGFTDITYAVGIVPSKLDAAAALVAQGVNLSVITDSEGVAKALASHPARLGVLLEVDCGDNRAGVQPDGPELERIAAVMRNARAARLRGVLTHAGHAYAYDDLEQVRDIARQERDAAVHAANRLRDLGVEVDTVSVGSTPTALYLDNADGLTELRAGVYVFFDLDQQSRGVCARDDIALSVLASVIGHNRAAGKILLDSGGLALSKDTGATAFRPEVGFGELCDLSTGSALGLFVSAVSQEHGHVAVRDEADYARLPVGSRVRVLPNHACMTAAAYDSYYLTAKNEVVGQWQRTNGW